MAILTFVNNFNAFDVVYAMENANGAPNYATDLIGHAVLPRGHRGPASGGHSRPGLGAAIATITFVMLSIFVIPTLIKTQGGD